MSDPSVAPAFHGVERFWLGARITGLLALGLLYHAVQLGTFSLNSSERAIVGRVLVGSMAILLVLILAKAFDFYGIERNDKPVVQYNLRRILNLAVWGINCLVVVSVLFANWYTAVFSFGLLSLVLGFALQAPVSSFLGWIYILTRAPYSVGDRIKIGGLAGDVIDVSYLDTTLWEFGGELLSTDHPSGRIIKFPNANVLSTPVINYTWPLFPYIWNELKFSVAYDTDLEFVAKAIQEIADHELGETMMERVRLYRDLLANTAIDALEVQEHPSVLFRVSDNTWLEAIVRYLVLPREAGRVKSALVRKILLELNRAPEKVRFPQGTER